MILSDPNMPEHLPRTAEPPAVVPPPDRKDVEALLRRILASPAFKGSQRCSDFLSHVVRLSLSGDTRALHERAIAVDLLGRPSSFDPSDDAIVRVQANEVRKRLARYYENGGSAEPFRIELPPGGYVPQFQTLENSTPDPPPPVAPPVAPRRTRFLWLAVPALAAAIIVPSAWPRSPLDDFWQPVFDQGNPLIICIPGIGALRPESGSELHRQLTAAMDLPPNHPDIEVNAAAGGRLYVQDNMVGMGASLGALRIAVHLGTQGKPFQTRIGQEVSFADLRSHPAVLLGAFSSRWTLEMNRDLPFGLVSEDGESRIREQKAPSRHWAPKALKNSGRADDDYALVARVIDSTSGQVVLIAAGITTYGTQAAAECLVDRHCIGQITASAPSDWPRRNIQAVLHTRILGNTPGPPRIVATRVW